MIEVVQKRSSSSIEYEEAAVIGDSSQDSGTDHDKVSDESMSSEAGSGELVQHVTDTLETLAVSPADNEEVSDNQDQDTRSPQGWVFSASYICLSICICISLSHYLSVCHLNSITSTLTYILAHTAII